jgi:hypothetical protein
MSQHRRGGASRFRGGVAIATAAALILGISAPALSADMATFDGVVVGADDTFADKFTVVYKDAATGQEYRSAPTNSLGQYQVSVPVGARYKLDSVVASDGTKLAVQNVPPIRVTTAGTNRVDVKFTSAVVGTGAAPAAAAAAAGEATTEPATTASNAPKKEEEKKKDKGGVPWWKRPGPITGIVLGSLAIGALAIGGSGGDNPTPAVSPSAPNH